MVTQMMFQLQSLSEQSVQRQTGFGPRRCLKRDESRAPAVRKFFFMQFKVQVAYRKRI